jgi:hypothetical protein
MNILLNKQNNLRMYEILKTALQHVLPKTY